MEEKERMIKDQQQKLKSYRVLNQDVKKRNILFTGSSLMEMFPINELLMTKGIPQIVYNRAIGGFTTEDMLNNMEEMVYGTEPSKIFINIGTNDISRENYTLEKLIENYKQIIILIQGRLPRTEINIMAYYPVNDTYGVFGMRTNENIQFANKAVEKLAQKSGCRYIDVNRGLTDEEGKLRKEYTIDGIHMYANGYRVVLENMKKYL